MSLSSAQITAQLESVLASKPDTPALAIRCATRQPWPDELLVQGRTFRLRWCESMLALREALTSLEDDASGAGLVLLTPLGTHQIADDIAARLVRSRVFQPEGWDMLRQLFGAEKTDVRLGRHAWMPQVLIEAAAQGAYEPAANGFLDLETAWRAVLQRVLQLPEARPDAVSLLRWTLRADADASLRLLPAPAREEVLQWLSQAGGLAGAMAVACVRGGRTGEAVPLGLVCDVVFAPAGEGEVALGHAAIRLERFVGDTHVGIAQGRAWAAAARELLLQDGLDRRRAVLDRADRLLAELRIAELAHLSDLLPSAFEQRLRALAEAVTEHVQSVSPQALARVEEAAQRVAAHALAQVQPQRAQRVAMAARLCRWLVQAGGTGRALEEAAAWQADEGAFVDWARFRLLGGDELPEVSAAMLALRQAVAARRQATAREFGQALQAWSRQPAPTGSRLVAVEQVLDRVVAALAARHPVLLLVLDGLSLSIFRELFAHVERQGWMELVPAGLKKPLAGIAALPTITEVSRASLLCGRLAAGGAAQEKAAFAAHPGLLAASRAGMAPRLFHKGDLAEDGNLAMAVRSAIADTHQQVVGVVHNAVDDHLSGPDQLHQRWSLEDLRLVLPLLREAREAQRLVIVTADHGHLLEDGTRRLPGGESDRWRPGDQVQAEDEIALAGPRVLTAEGARAVVCLWSETARYAGRRNGYHGGVSPQEVVVPLSVLAPGDAGVEGWMAAPPVQPEWWEAGMGVAAVAPAAPVAAPPAPRRKPRASEAQQALFEADAPPPAQVPAPQAGADWIDRLLASPVYASQRQLAARVALPDEQMRRLLTALQERGGQLPRTVLAQRMDMPGHRLGSLLSAARRLLNVDQASVLSVDDASATVLLNRALLAQQFGVAVDEGSCR